MPNETESTPALAIAERKIALEAEITFLTGLTDQFAAAQKRLTEVLSGCEITEGELHEAQVLVAGLAEMPGNMMAALGYSTELLDENSSLFGRRKNAVDDSTAPAVHDDEGENEPANPGSSGMLMALGKLYEAQHAIHAMLHAIRNMEITETIAVDTDAHTCAALRAANQILNAADEIETAAGVEFSFGLLTDEDRFQLRQQMWGAIG